MKVLIVNTSDRAGGAAVAANRLMVALNNHGVQARMLVRDKETDDVRVLTLPRSPLLRWHFLWERLLIFCRLHFKRDHLFELDTARCGTDITRLQAFREADVIHLHWVNQGMLSLADLRRILLSGKPVVWTMHDVWPATAICHLTLGCRSFVSGCHHCKYLPGGGSSNDLSARVWRQKKRLLSKGNMVFVACSKWLESEAKSSALLKGQKVTSIPNAIDARLYQPGNQREARSREHLPEDLRLLLFVCQRVTNPNKGMQYLIEACNTLAAEHPEMTSQTGVVIMGSHADEVADQLPFRTFQMGYVSDDRRIADIYRAVDAFVLPSLSENLPNTIMEAMACGVPCVGFKIGGIPEMIDHQKNGYVARYRDAADLAHGIRWVLYEGAGPELRQAAVRKVAHAYSPTAVAMAYTEVYNEAMAMKQFKL